MVSNKKLTEMLDKEQTENSHKGYYADDELEEDRIIPNEAFGECINYSLAGKGYHLVQENSIDRIIELTNNYAAHKNKYAGNSEMLQKLEVDFTKQYKHLMNL